VVQAFWEKAVLPAIYFSINPPEKKYRYASYLLTILLPLEKEKHRSNGLGFFIP
jgi:hypothetical protein